MDSRKDKLPDGRSYPLRPSLLEAAIAEARLQLPVKLTRWDYKRKQTLEATFSPEPGLATDVGFWVVCGAVPSDQVAVIRECLENEGIPQFIQWAREMEELDERSPRRSKPQHFLWKFPKAAA